MTVVAAEPRHQLRQRRDRDRVIVENLALVKALARRFANRGERLDDLVQVGSIGLINAADRYDGRRGVDFRAYAVPTIVGEIQRHLRDHAGVVRVPRRDQQARGAMRRAWRELGERLDRSPTWAELTASGVLADDDAARALAAERAASPVSLSGLEDARQPSLEDEGLAAGENRELVRAAFRALTRRERAVVSLAYFGDLNQQEVAAKLGISQSQTSRLLATALTKMRDALSRDFRCEPHRNGLDS